MRFTENYEIESASQFMALMAHSENNRGSYVRDIQVLYSGEPATYIAQALSAGITSIFFGLISNYLYDHLVGKYGAKRDSQIEEKIASYKKDLAELRGMLESGKVESEKHFLSIANEHQSLLKCIGDKKKIEEMVQDAINQLQQRGADGLRDEIDSNFRD